MPARPVREQVWDAVPLGARGYDDPSQVLPAIAAYLAPRWRKATGEPTLEEPLCEVAIRAQFAVIAERAGWASRALALDPRDAGQRWDVLGIAWEVEYLARALRCALLAEESAS